MLKVRFMMAALFGALAFSVLVASSASAGWFLEGAELPAGSKAALASTGKVAETSTLLAPALELAVVCGSSTLDSTSPEIIGENTLKASALKFLACNTTKPTSGCALEVTNQVITTLPLKATVREATVPADRLLVTPQTKTTLAEIPFSEANTCALAGLQPVKGSLTLNAPTLQEEQAEQPIEGLGSTENNSLELAGGNKIYIDKGKVLLKLATGVKWKFKPPEFVTTTGGKINVAAKVKGKQIFTFTEGPPEYNALSNIECSKGEFKGEVDIRSPKFILMPVVEECVWIEEQGKKAKNNRGKVEVTPGCKYELLVFLNTAPGVYAGALTLTPAKCVIKFHAFEAEPLCEVEIKQENTPGGLFGPTLENRNGPIFTGLLIPIKTLPSMNYASNGKCSKKGFANGALFAGYQGEVNEESEGIIVK
jgi:hypothetical protein